MRALAILALSAAAAGAQQKVPGWTLTMRTTIDSANGAAPFSTEMKVTGSGKRARQQMAMRNMPPMASIMNAEDSTMTVVMEQMGMAVTTSIGAARGRLPKVDVSSIRTQRVELGTESVNGKLAKHARVAMTALHSQTYNGLTCTKQDANELEIWTVRDTVLPAVMKSFTSTMQSLMGGVSETMVNGPPAGAVPPGEAGVKMVSRQVNTVSGKPVTITVEYLDYGFLDVDPALLAVPAGFNVQDMRSMDMSAMIGGSLSERAEQMFWMQFDTTAAAGSQRATCKRQ